MTESTTSDISIKIKNYKCFDDELQGFDEVKPINVIIGKNNSGKSSLLDLISFSSTDEFSIPKERYCKGKNPQIFITKKIEEKSLQQIFRKGTSGGGISGDHWAFGKKFLGDKITFLN